VAILRIDEKSGIYGSHVKISLNGAQSVLPQEPTQLEASETEKQSIGERMVELAGQIEEFLRDGKFWIPTYEVMKLTGLTSGAAAQAFRHRWYDELRERYKSELLPNVIELYSYARVRGFFDVEIEELYSPPVLIDVEKLPPLFRGLAERAARASGAAIYRCSAGGSLPT
jgi:hypothetical protein